MQTIIYTFVLSIGLCFAASRPQAATVYLWTDDSGRLYITSGPPPEDGQVRDVYEYESRSRPEPIEPSAPSETDGSNSSDTEVQCRNVFEARRNLRGKKVLATAVRKRAQEARDKVKELRDRIGFDDDRRDDFKDDLKRQEQNARRAEMLSEQAGLEIKIAQLQVKLAEYEAGGPCTEKREYESQRAG